MTHPAMTYHDLTAEQAVLGTAMLDPASLTKLTTVIGTDDFYRPAHTTIWATVVGLAETGQRADPVTVAHALDTAGELQRVGGADYLHTLIASVPTTANGTHYAAIVAEHAKRRRLALLGMRLTAAAASGTDPADLLDTGRALLDTAPGETWPAPIPLGARRQLPAFPVQVLPGWLADMVTAVAHFTQTPVDLAGCIALAALSTAAGGRAVVEVRGSWTEPVNLYLVTVLPPGSRKSPVFKAITAPLLAAERGLIETTRPMITEAALALRVATQAAERAAVAAANSATGAGDNLMAEASAAAMQAEAITIPVQPQLIADDVTPETATTILAEQGGRLAVLSAEGGIFSILAGRYSGTPNLELFLKGHAGDMMRVNRRSRDEHIDNPALTLGLAVQPEVLRNIAQMPGFRGKGLLARILFAVPVNTVGYREIGTDPVPDQVNDTYTRNLTAMVASLAEWTDPAVLPLTPEANALILDVERDVEPRLRPGAEWSHIVDWASKYTGAVVRLAGLLHLAEHLRDGWGKPITADTVRRAIALGRYFAEHALGAFDDMGADPVTEDARALLAWIEANQAARFTKRELFSGVHRGRFRKVGDLDPGLTLLETHGYIRAEAQPERSGPGRRPSPGYLAHPTVIANGTDATTATAAVNR